MRRGVLQAPSLPHSSKAAYSASCARFLKSAGLHASRVLPATCFQLGLQRSGCSGIRNIVYLTLLKGLRKAGIGSELDMQQVAKPFRGTHKVSFEADKIGLSSLIRHQTWPYQGKESLLSELTRKVDPHRQPYNTRLFVQEDSDAELAAKVLTLIIAAMSATDADRHAPLRLRFVRSLLDKGMPCFYSIAWIKRPDSKAISACHKDLVWSLNQAL